MRKLLTEFIGTFFLVFTIGMTVSQGVAMAPLAIGASLMIMVYLGGHVSGAHYNPAVSVAVFMRGKISVAELIQYTIAQNLGAVAAAFLAYIIVGKAVGAAPAVGVSTMAALLTEILYTFALALVVLNVAVSAKTQGNSYYGLAIGFTITVAAFAGGGISGGAFNPAVGTGLNIVNTMTGGGGLSHIWIYWVGPLVGAALAAVVFGVQED
ncbi:MAG: aquaporin [Gemmatimonadota bacterium]